MAQMACLTRQYMQGGGDPEVCADGLRSAHLILPSRSMIGCQIIEDWPFFWLSSGVDTTLLFEVL